MTFEEWRNANEFGDCSPKAAWEAGFKQCRELINTTGYVLVPVEPTEKMLKAGEELEYFEGGYGSTCDEFYKAMIQAAQEK